MNNDTWYADDPTRHLRKQRDAIIRHISFLRGFATPKLIIHADGSVENITKYPEIPPGVTELLNDINTKIREYEREEYIKYMRSSRV